MDAGLTGLHTMMVEARAAAEHEARTILETATAKHGPNGKLDADEDRRFRTAIETRDALSARCKELSDEIARCGMDSPLVQLVRSGNPTAPMREWFDTESMKALHHAVTSRQSLRVESRTVTSPTSLIPSSLYPYTLGPQYENRLLDRLPQSSTEAGAVEYIVHQSTTGAPAVTAEGEKKPEIIYNLDRQTATVQKIASHVAASWEALNDFASFEGYVSSELFRQVIDVENNELLNGAGAGHIVGLLATPNVLPYSVGVSETALDALEAAIATMRVGPALAVCDVIVLHPATWSEIRRSKDLQDRYLVTANPLADTASTAWGVPVVQTTTIARGVGLLLDSTKFGRVHILRQPLSLQVGYAEDDLIRNLTRFICEERIALAVERPPAVLIVDGLPTGIDGC